MAREHVTLLQRMISERRLTREQVIKLLYRRAEQMQVHDFALSVRQLDRWLAGEVATLPRASMCRVIEAEFGQPVERLLAPINEHPPILGPATVERIDVRAMVGAASQSSARFGQWADSLGIGDLALAVVWQRLGQLATEYVYAPMVPVFRDLVSLRDDIFEMLAAPDPTQARDLYLLGGTACGLLAHASGNFGNVRAAQVQASTALICARKAEHPTLAAWVLGVQALQSEWTGHADRSLQLVAEAQTYATHERIPSTVPVWLAAIAARAHARRGHHDSAVAALREADDNRCRVPALPSDRNEFDSLGGILTFAEAKQHYYAGTTRRRIGDFEQAEVEARAAISTYSSGPVDQRSYGDESIAWVDIAIARASGQKQDLDGAWEALAVIERQPADNCLPTLLGPLEDLLAALSKPAVRDQRRAVEMRDAIREISAWCRRPAEIGT
jgi:hypothetical protein